MQNKALERLLKIFGLNPLRLGQAGVSYRYGRRAERSTSPASLEPIMAKNLTPVSAPVAPEQTAPVSTPEVAAAPAVKVPKVALGTITLLVTANPKRPGTIAHRTFALYANGMSTHEFIAKGGFAAALAWDIKHKFIAVK